MDLPGPSPSFVLSDRNAYKRVSCLLQELLELARIGVGNHVSKTLRHRRRFDFPAEQARHRSTAWAPDAGGATSSRVPRGPQRPATGVLGRRSGRSEAIDQCAPGRAPRALRRCVSCGHSENADIIAARNVFRGRAGPRRKRGSPRERRAGKSLARVRASYRSAGPKPTSV